MFWINEWAKILNFTKKLLKNLRNHITFTEGLIKFKLNKKQKKKKILKNK